MVAMWTNVHKRINTWYGMNTRNAVSTHAASQVDGCLVQASHVCSRGACLSCVGCVCSGRYRGARRRTKMYQAHRRLSTTMCMSIARLKAVMASTGPSHQKCSEVIPMPSVCRGTPSDAPKNTHTCSAIGARSTIRRPRPCVRDARAAEGECDDCMRASAKIPSGHTSKARRYRRTSSAILARQWIEAWIDAYGKGHVLSNVPLNGVPMYSSRSQNCSRVPRCLGSCIKGATPCNATCKWFDSCKRKEGKMRTSPVDALMKRTIGAMAGGGGWKREAQGAGTSVNV